MMRVGPFIARRDFSERNELSNAAVVFQPPSLIGRDYNNSGVRLEVVRFQPLHLPEGIFMKRGERNSTTLSISTPSLVGRDSNLATLLRAAKKTLGFNPFTY